MIVGTWPQRAPLNPPTRQARGTPDQATRDKQYHTAKGYKIKKPKSNQVSLICHNNDKATTEKLSQQNQNPKPGPRNPRTYLRQGSAAQPQHMKFDPNQINRVQPAPPALLPCSSWFANSMRRHTSAWGFGSLRNTPHANYGLARL